MMAGTSNYDITTEKMEEEQESDVQISEDAAGDDHQDSWLQDPKFERYWRHREAVQEWFQHHTHLLHQPFMGQPPPDPASLTFREEVLKRAQEASHCMFYYWHQARYWAALCHEDIPEFPGEWRAMSDPTTSNKRKNSWRRSRSRGSKGRGGNPTKKKRLQGSFTDGIVLDFDTELLENAEHGVECRMEITPELLEFFAHSAKHRTEREALKKIELENDTMEERHVDISEASLRVNSATSSAPTERPNMLRTREMQQLYGKGAAMIHGMETAMQLSFDRNADRFGTKLWPHLPLNIQF